MNNPGVAGVREPDPLGSSTSHSLPLLLKLYWLKGLGSFLDLNELAHFYHHRTYAIAGKSKWVAGILYTVAATQLGVGLYIFINTVENQGQYLYTIKHALEFLKEKFSAAEMSEIPLDSYHICLPHVGSTWTIVQMCLSLGFGMSSLFLITPPFPRIEPLSVPIDLGVLVFVIVQTQILKLRNRGMKVSSILSTVTRDAVIFFVVISSSHVLVVIMYSTAGVGFFSPAFEFNVC